MPTNSSYNNRYEPQRRPSGYNGSRPQSRPSGSSQRPNGGRVPPRRRKSRRKRVTGRFYLTLAVLALIIVLVVVLLPKNKSDDAATQQAPVVAEVTEQTEQAAAEETAAEETVEEAPQTNEELAAMLADSDAEVTALAAEDQIQVSDLDINTSLPDTWMNVLLLGTDERNLTDNSRTDCMMICSINRETGEVKLASIMRDTAVTITGSEKYNGTWRINTANYFGGPKLAMRTVNNLLDMNIQYYVMVNFFGFQKIAHALGGIDVDLTEAEMTEINERIYEQAKMAYKAGIDESDLADENKVYLTSYGENIHLNGRQTLAYARLRHMDNDYVRTQRQHTVLTKLLQKVKDQGATGLITLATSMFDQVSTNMELNDIINIALVVLTNGVDDIDSMRIPINGTYVEERRNDDAMLYDTDWEKNAVELYSFIYG